jgi:hypothetical protein
MSCSQSDNGSNFDRAITLGCDDGSSELEALTFLYCAKALCDNANCNVALSLPMTFDAVLKYLT